MTTTMLQGDWTVDPSRSSVRFRVKHLGFATVTGSFKALAGRLELGDDLGAARASGFVRVDSIDTGEPPRDEFLRSAGFFDAARFPEITFASSELRAIDAKTFEIIGDLTLRDVTRPVTLVAVVDSETTDAAGSEQVTLKVTGTITRADFGLRFDQALGTTNTLVADKVTLELALAALKVG